jgi:hypothetical protein
MFSQPIAAHLRRKTNANKRAAAQSRGARTFCREHGKSKR